MRRIYRILLVLAILVVSFACIAGLMVFGPRAFDELANAWPQPTPQVIEKEVVIKETVEVEKIVEVEVPYTNTVYVEVTPQPGEIGANTAVETPLEVTVSGGEAEPGDIHLEKHKIYNILKGYVIHGDTRHRGMKWPDSDDDTGQIVVMAETGQVEAPWEATATWEGDYTVIAEGMLETGCFENRGCLTVTVYEWPSGKVITTVVRSEVVAAAAVPTVVVETAPSLAPSAPVTTAVEVAVTEELPDISIPERETRFIPTQYSCVGDIQVEGIQLHDGDGDTGLVVHFKEGANAYAEWGASCTAARPPETLRDELINVSGCGENRTCESARIRYWPLSEEEK